MDWQAEQEHVAVRFIVRRRSRNAAYVASTRSKMSSPRAASSPRDRLDVGPDSGATILYGVLSYVVVERTQEIGVRMALGARAKQIQRMVVAQEARVVILGVVIGVVIAGGTTRALGSLLFGVEAVAVFTFLLMSATMLVVGPLASYLPAQRASNIDPMESLRGKWGGGSEKSIGPGRSSDPLSRGRG